MKHIIFIQEEVHMQIQKLKTLISESSNIVFLAGQVCQLRAISQTSEVKAVFLQLNRNTDTLPNIC